MVAELGTDADLTHLCCESPDRIHLRLTARGAHLSTALAAAYRIDDCLSVHCTSGGVLVEARLQLACADEPVTVSVHEAETHAAVAEVAAELTRGDRRLLHLLWLAAVQHGHVDDDVPEPAVPARLARPSQAQQVIAELVALSQDLARAAAEPAPRRPPRTAGQLLGREAALAWQRRHDAQVERERRSAQWQRTLSEADAAWARLQVHRAPPQLVWRQVESTVLRGNPREYRRAAAVLLQLGEQVAGSRSEEFERRLADLRRRHAGRGVFLATLDSAGLSPQA